MKLAVCGLDCGACEFSSNEKKCPGCQALEGRIFWGECDLYLCAAGRGLSSCGDCADLACAMLREWAGYDPSDERIENLRRRAK